MAIAQYPVDAADQASVVLAGNPGAAGRGTDPADGPVSFRWEEGPTTAALTDIGFNEAAQLPIAQLVLYSTSFDDNITRATSIELTSKEAYMLARKLREWAKGVTAANR